MINKKINWSFWSCIIVTMGCLLLYTINGFDSLELKAVDFRFQVRGDRPIHPDIVVITVDEASIEKIGRWPWPRARHGILARKLKRAGVQVLAFDTLFTEDDVTNRMSDNLLALAAKETGIVVSAYFYKGAIDNNNRGIEPLVPYEELLESSRSTGFVNLEPDRDGVTRRSHLYAVEDEDAVYPSLAVAAFAARQGKSFSDITDDLPIVLGTDPDFSKNSLFINFATEYPQYSYADVLDETMNLKDTFEGKTVFVGATAAALFDLKAIPFVSKYPGVLIHANIVDNLIQGNHITEIESYWTAFYIILIGLVLGFFLHRLSPWGQLALFVSIVGGGIGLALLVFSSYDLVIHMVPPFLTGLGCYGSVLFYRLVIEEREKRKIRGSFQQYLSPKIIKIITQDPSKLKLGGEEREVTIFFLDIAGFTTMSEALKPSQLVEVMNQCLTSFSRVIHKNDGLINKYIGDCIMAFWNAPTDQADHAAKACYAALDCIQALPDLNQTFKEKGLPNIDCRIGINTGTVVVGNMGSHERFDYTVMGDPVNLASRLEGANKQYHTHVMISESTFEAAKKDIEARDIDLIRVKGKKEPKKVFELIARRGELPDDYSKGRAKYHEALGLYRRRNFEDAVHTFQEVFDYIPNDHLSRVYLERTRQFMVSPPPKIWDGVFEMKTK